MKYFLTLAAVLFPLVAMAAEKPALDPALCKAMVTHQPAADVAYKPGVDVRGKPVVEADLHSYPVQVPEVLTFDLSVDALAYARLATPAGVEAKGKTGTITFEKGRLFFDGAPMEGQAEAALRSLCAEKPVLQKQGKSIYNQ